MFTPARPWRGRVFVGGSSPGQLRPSWSLQRIGRRAGAVSNLTEPACRSPLAARLANPELAAELGTVANRRTR